MNSHSAHAFAAALAFCSNIAGAQAVLAPPGQYEILVTQELPNVLRAAEPVRTKECLSLERIHSGEAFRLRSDNPVNACPLSRLHFDGDQLTYRIICPEPNAPRAKAVFERTRAGYDGAISLDMGGKNMIMTERQSARRIGECPGENKVHSNARYDAEHYRETRHQPGEQR